MELVKRVFRNYWLVYYVLYVGGVALGLGRYWPQLTAHDGVLWLAAIFGVSAGSALLVAIFLEVMGRMVLLIPAAIKKIKEEGRREGRREGRQEERRRIAEALRQAGEREDGSVHITLTPEVMKLLMGEIDDNL